MNKNQVSDTVFEALFRQAIIDDFNEEMDSIPTNEQLARIYSFSSKFEMHIKKFLQRIVEKALPRRSFFIVEG
ncbi:hypothetical protein ACR77J_11465 [Tissierella praeacuta]|uniref:hypothetical protein n=1 Tax=Tissierella praeacuta TaxID=43131 RepID=UPI003DA50684